MTWFKLYFLQNFIESGAGRKFGSLKALENFLLEENACITTLKVQKPSKQVIFGLTINNVRYQHIYLHGLSLSKSNLCFLFSQQWNQSLESKGLVVWEVTLNMSKKCSSVAEEDQITPKSSKHTIQSAVSFKTT